MKKLPEISVIMSVYNGETYLKSAIDSILNQTFTNFEFIIINDGSSDGTESILNEYMLADARIKVLNQNNLGLTSSLNRGVSVAVGKYIARFDADDISYSNRLEIEKKFLDINLNYVLVASSVYFIDENGNKFGRLYPLICDFLLKKQIEYINPFIHSTIMMRADVLKKVGGYNPVIKQICEDYNLWYRMKDYGKFKILQKPLIDFRVHDKNMSSLTEFDNAKREISNFIKNSDLTISDFNQLVSVLKQKKTKEDEATACLSTNMNKFKKMILFSNIFSYTFSLFKSIVYGGLSQNYLTYLYYNKRNK